MLHLEFLETRPLSLRKVLLFALNGARAAGDEAAARKIVEMQRFERSGFWKLRRNQPGGSA